MFLFPTIACHAQGRAGHDRIRQRQGGCGHGSAGGHAPKLQQRAGEVHRRLERKAGRGEGPNRVRWARKAVPQDARVLECAFGR